MLVLSRDSAALTADERGLPAWWDVAPRTSARPTDQRSGELTGDLLVVGSLACIADEVDVTDEADIPFSPVPDGASVVVASTAFFPSLTSLSPLPRTAPGDTTMQFKNFQQGGCQLQVFTTDLALFAVVFRHAAQDDTLQALTPLMSTTLDGLASAFEQSTLITLEQTGHVRLVGEETLSAEAVQALCQRVVVEGVETRVRVAYETNVIGSADSGGSNMGTEG